jgi:uncharacterized protein
MTMRGRTHSLASLDALRDLREPILQIAHRRKATNIRVFGSIARGAANDESDIDFLVSMEPDATLVDLIGLEQDLKALLGREVDVLTDDAVHPHLEEEVRSSAVRL